MRTRHVERDERERSEWVDPPVGVQGGRVETRKDRRALARDAGMGQLSLTSILAGTLTAYGAVAVLLAIVGGVAAAINNGTDFSNVAWTQLKTGAGITVAVVLLVSYLYGGYVAGRMARRSGALNGFCVFILGVALAMAIGVLVKQAGGGSSITTALRNVGAPTTWHEWRDVGTIAGIASLVAMLLGSVVGGSLGDRWHTKLVARALDPTVGPEAGLSRQAATKAAEADGAHLAAEERVARAQGEHFATPAAANEAAVAERQAQREARLADERRGLVEPPATAPIRAADQRPERDARPGTAPVMRDERDDTHVDTTTGRSGLTHAERAAAAGTGTTRRAAADEAGSDYRPDTFSPGWDRTEMGDRVTVPDNGGHRMAGDGAPVRHRSFMDKLLHR